MDIKDILQLNDLGIKAHIEVLSAAYKSLTGNTLCRQCPDDVQAMLFTLKKHYNMSNFVLQQPLVIYRIDKGNPRTISNPTMTDELAIEFLSVRPSRIKLFAVHPENWESLLNPELNKEKAPCCDDDHVDKPPCEECIKKKQAAEAKAKLEAEQAEAEAKLAASRNAMTLVQEIISDEPALNNVIEEAGPVDPEAVEMITKKKRQNKKRKGFGLEAVISSQPDPENL